MEDESTPPVEVPHTELSAAALRGVIEAWVLREGTEYGEREHTLEEKVAAVQDQLERGDARILYSPQTRQVELVLTRELGRQRPPPAGEGP